MATTLVQLYTCLIILMVFVDKGDGRWRKKNKEDLKHDIDTFKIIADKIEREMEHFYEDYSAEYDEDYHTNKGYLLNHEKKTGYYNFTNNSRVISNIDQIHANNTNQDIEVKKKNEPNVTLKNYIMNRVNKTKSNDNWPKFEDIILEMGKQYDWKNDRWIKVKRKGLKKALDKINSKVNVHEKHNFKYRLVKLNRNKSRRNVVIAVTAVR